MPIPIIFNKPQIDRLKQADVSDDEIDLLNYCAHKIIEEFRYAEEKISATEVRSELNKIIKKINEFKALIEPLVPTNEFDTALECEVSRRIHKEIRTQPLDKVFQFQSNIIDETLRSISKLELYIRNSITALKQNRKTTTSPRFQ